MRDLANRQSVKVGKQTLQLSNLDKVLYPYAEFTKAAVVDYYLKIAPFILPHLERRPVTLKRFPHGVLGEYFYEKNCPSHRPDWVKTGRVQDRSNGDFTEYCLINDLETLIWVANLAALELHPLLARIEEIERPTMVVFDLDPGQPAKLIDCVRVALHLRKLLQRVGLQSFPKLSGKKGLQVYVPLNCKEVNFDLTKAFAKTVAESLQQMYPKLVVSNMRKDLRKGKVLVDWSQNSRHKTTVCVYSLRAGNSPTVSMPVSWQELEEARHERDTGALPMSFKDAIKRTEQLGDLFKPVLSLKQRLPHS